MSISRFSVGAYPWRIEDFIRYRAQLRFKTTRRQHRKSGVELHSMNRQSTAAVLRCFVAIASPLSRAAQPLIGELDSLAAAEDIQLRVAPPENLHLTLKFIGDVDADQLGLIDSCLRHQSIRQQPLKLRCQGLGLFSDTLYLHIDCNDALAALVTKLNEALTFLGYSKESREFVPHITLARFRASTPQGIFAPILEKYRDTLWGELSVDSIVLYRSETLAKGARYSAIVRYPLGE